MLRIRHACLFSVLGTVVFSSTFLYSQGVPQQLPALAATRGATVALTPFELSPAKIGVSYAYALATNRRAEFRKARGNADWLTVSAEGVISGTPTEDTRQEVEITVYAYALDANGNREPEAPLGRTFTVRVQPNSCLSAASDSLAWCDDPKPVEIRPPKQERFSFESQGITPKCTESEDPAECREKTFAAECNDPKGEGCILQFDRLGKPLKRFGYYNPKENRIHWFTDLPKDLSKDSIVNAINGSKVFLSGSVLIHREVTGCRFWA